MCGDYRFSVNAFIQVKVDEETAGLLTLNTPLGLIRMNRMNRNILKADDVAVGRH